jgi:hypothetical protein
MWNQEPIRLVGIRLDNLVDNDNYQLSLFDKLEKRENDSKLEKTIDKLKEKYGANIFKKIDVKSK